ncbi:methyltransferase domain-containing protein [Leptothermofonsia sichuanensis E412]|uniref:class I SAM-dependent methyltransferase n=1 Tax=Leptothermofonsia sichuanensis TaxID=2917832 RepID=UPI001CA6E6AD|nr:class I SAM-dependent methyltransferase [Leptothermofonsia sichuanensis]QZZ18581.1 methyltransferase domain-containing protein [Leptothermofonsia sichuanensis E412]
MLEQLPVTLSQFFSEPNNSLHYWEDEIPVFKIPRLTPAIRANSEYFSDPVWAGVYLESCHRDRIFVDRWQAAIGRWQGKIVVDIGCGPGNLYAALQSVCGVPRLLIGVDVALGALKLARQLGYVPVLADAQQLPFVSGFADVVVVNATIHHCDDMEKTLLEAARLVRPGGMLITDHDPQCSAWNNNWIAKLIWNARLPIYRLIKRGGHGSAREQRLSLATEVHHRIGDGVSADLFHRVLEPLGFTVNLYPHNMAGSEVFCGDRGRAGWKIRLAQRLCGVKLDQAESALLLMCRATRQK